MARYWKIPGKKKGEYYTLPDKGDEPPEGYTDEELKRRGKRLKRLSSR